MIDDDTLDVVLQQESRHPGVVLCRGTFVVQSVPGDLNLLPLDNFTVRYLGYGDTLRPAPPGVDLSITGYWYTNDHVCNVLWATEEKKAFDKDQGTQLRARLSTLFPAVATCSLVVLLTVDVRSWQLSAIIGECPD